MNRVLLAILSLATALTGQVNHGATPAICATCHAKIVASYLRTGMGQSFAPITAAEVPESTAP